MNHSETGLSGSDSPTVTLGKITAQPNPLPSDASVPLTLRWETNANEAEVYVAEDGAPEKLLARGKVGSREVTWIPAGRSYSFRLYALAKQRRLLDEVAVQRKVSGTLSVQLDSLEGRAVLEWEIATPATAEICMVDEGCKEMVICRGGSGSFAVANLSAGVNYLFRLYAGTERQLLDEVVVQVPDIPWTKLLERVKDAPEGRGFTDGLSEFIAGVLPSCLRRPEFPAWFQRWESRGFHVTPVHFYEPIPDSRTLKDELWTQAHELVGIDMNEKMQLHLLREIFPQFQEECDRLPVESAQPGNDFYLRNGRFENLDPLVAYCLIRHFRPQQIIEVGGGYSTLLLALAARKNGSTVLRSIEPYPAEFLTKGVDGLAELLTEKVEDIDLSYFSGLEENDCLFIDTSHVVRIGGDVNYLFLEVLPRLKPGVIVHIHDIFLPFDYPQVWVTERRRFWTEQYLLQAFLTCNSDFEVLVSNSYLSTYHLEELERVFPKASPPREGGSFWMRRKPLNSQSEIRTSKDRDNARII